MTNLCKRTKYNLAEIPHSDYIAVSKSLISAENVHIEMSIVSCPLNKVLLNQGFAVLFHDLYGLSVFLEFKFKS